MELRKGLVSALSPVQQLARMGIMVTFKRKSEILIPINSSLTAAIDIDSQELVAQASNPPKGASRIGVKGHTSIPRNNYSLIEAQYRREQCWLIKCVLRECVGGEKNHDFSYTPSIETGMVACMVFPS
jgi:hypothetical protein